MERSNIVYFHEENRENPKIVKTRDGSTIIQYFYLLNPYYRTN